MTQSPRTRFISKLRPPSGHRASGSPVVRSSIPSRIPQPRMSFLSPKEVWSPLVPSPKLRTTNASTPAKFQLRDPGPTTGIPTRRAVPRPQLGSRVGSNATRFGVEQGRPGLRASPSTRKAIPHRPPTNLPSLTIKPPPAKTPSSAPLTSQASNTSSASSACSTASSLARHRAIHVRRKLIRNPSSTASTHSSLSTLSEGSIETTATVSDNLLHYSIALIQSDSQDDPHLNQSSQVDIEEYLDAKTYVDTDTTPRGLCAPYLVPAQGPPVTLEWVRDPEADEMDEAEAVWRSMEEKMGRRLRGPSLRERGRWVVRLQENVESESMQRVESDFSLSAYVTSESEASTPTALFDMSAPLIPSVSSSACTPQNTPCLRRETLQRGRRVQRQKGMKDINEMVRSDSSSTSPNELIPIPTYSPIQAIPPAVPMYRLDSQVVSALEALQDAVDSPDLDLALGLHPPPLPRSLALTPVAEQVSSPEEMSPLIEDVDDIDGGLGLGIPLQLDSVYHLPVFSPRIRARRQASSSSQGLSFSGDREQQEWGFAQYKSSQRMMGMDSDEEEVLRIMDLDTGVMREVRLDGLGEQGL